GVVETKTSLGSRRLADFLVAAAARAESILEMVRESASAFIALEDFGQSAPEPVRDFPHGVAVGRMVIRPGGFDAIRDRGGRNYPAASVFRNGIGAGIPSAGTVLARLFSRSAAATDTQPH